MSEEKNILKWAGLAGIAGVVSNVLSLTTNATLVPIFVSTQSGCGAPCNVDASLSSFPDVKA